MIWQEQVSVVAMTTRETEEGKVRAALAPVVQRQTAVIVHFSIKQLLLFDFARQIELPMQYLATYEEIILLYKVKRQYCLLKKQTVIAFEFWAFFYFSRAT